MLLVEVMPRPDTACDDKPEDRKDRAQDKESFKLHAVHDTGEDATDGRFLAVITLTEGDPRAITAEGAGLEAKVRIGKQTAHFDGEKVTCGH